MTSPDATEDDDASAGDGVAAGDDGAARDSAGRPRVASSRVTDCSALLGAALWIGLVAASRPALLPGSGTETVALDLPELFVALASLVVVPLGLGVAATPPRASSMPAAPSSTSRDGSSMPTDPSSTSPDASSTPAGASSTAPGASPAAPDASSTAPDASPAAPTDDRTDPTGTGARPGDPIGTSPCYRLAVVAQLPCAVAATAAMALPRGSTAGVALAATWLVPTGAVAIAGGRRLVARRGLPVQELAIDAALLYLPISAVALILHRAAIDFHFRPVIVLLTAVHYQYAGFALPLVVGRVGRLLAERDALAPLGSAAGDPRWTDASRVARLATAATVVLVLNVALIAVGITFSPAVEVVAVVLFAAAVLAFALLALVRVVPALPRSEGLLLAVAFGTLFWTLALAVAYAYSAFPATGHLVGVGQMIELHGVVNALGFALPALLALRLRDDVR